MAELIDSEMSEAGVLLSLLGSKRHLDTPDEETVVFTNQSETGTATTTDSASSVTEVSPDRTRSPGKLSSPLQSNPYRRSILKPTPLKPPGSPTKQQSDPYRLPHRKLVEISVVLSSDDAATECYKVIVHLFKQFLDVDPEAALLPLEGSSALAPIRTASQLPGNWTKLGRFVYLKGGAYTLRPRTTQHGDRKQAEPWLVLHLASSMETSFLLQAVSIEFDRVNGRTIRVKACQAFNSFTPLMFPFLFNKAHLPSLVSQLCELLLEARQQMEQAQLLDTDDLDRPIPEFSLRTNVPRLPYQASAKDKKFDSLTAQNKRVIHLECCESAAPFLIQLFQFIKSSGAMRRTFGKYVHVTEPLTFDACGQDCALLRRMAQLHTNFHNSVQLHSINGIVNITATASIWTTTERQSSATPPRSSFLEILYSLRQPDKSPLFLSIFPRPGGTVVDCIIPNTAGAETRLVQMNRHLPGYLKFYLKELGYNHDGIVELLNRACDPDLTSTISQLTWDDKNKVVILPSEADMGYDLDSMEQEPWMQVTAVPTSFQNGAKRTYNDPDHAFPLNSDLSVTTIHAKPRRSDIANGDSSPIPPQGRSPSKGVVIIDPATQDDVSTLSSMTKNDLIRMLLHLNQTSRHLSGATGFAPTGEDSPHNGPQAITASQTTNGSSGSRGRPFAAAMGE